MDWLGLAGAAALYLVAWLGGGYLATILFAIVLDKTRWARTAELGFFVPVLQFALVWFVVGAMIGLLLIGRLLP